MGGDNVNLVQQAYYNGNYGFCGAKVQHVLQADGIWYSFTCPLYHHYASGLCSSSMITMLLVLNVNNDVARSVKLPIAVEHSFNNIVRKFIHSDYLASHHILQQDRSNWPYLRTLWDLQALFYNLFTYAQGHGNPCNDILGVATPTIEEYIYSANHNLLVPFPIYDGEDDNFSVKPDGNARLYYHVSIITKTLLMQIISILFFML